MKTTLFALLFLFSLILSYQNCGEQPLNRKSQSSKPSSLDGEFCSLIKKQAQAKTKIIFLVDLSVSNYGAYDKTKPTIPFDPSKASDPQMLRLAAIEDVATKFPDAQFALVGFEKTLKEPKGGSRFVDADTAKTHTTEYRNYQKSQLTLASTLKGISSGTDYLPPLEKARELIFADVFSNPAEAKATNYFIFLMSDGEPSGAPDPTPTDACPIPDSLWESTTRELATLSGVTQGLSIKPILYNQNLSELTSKAKCIMDKIAVWAGEPNSTVLADIQKLDLTSMIGKVKMKVQMSSFGVVNLTAFPSQDDLIADSDADGIPDAEEASLGFKPDNPRTNGFTLDRVTYLYSPSTSCTPATSTPLRINNCEKALLKDLPHPNSYDSDGDHIADFIEIVKGTYPGADDANDNPDNDDAINLIEILTGRNPNSPDDSRPAYMRVQASKSLVGSCSLKKDKWAFSVSNIPLVPTRAVSAWPTPNASSNELDYNHLENENLILIYYEEELANTPEGADQRTLWGVLKKLKYGEANSVTINKSEFKKLGTLP